MKTNNFTNERAESIRVALESTALMDYNEAYYRWVYGPEKDEKKNHDLLVWHRHNYFSM